MYEKGSKCARETKTVHQRELRSKETFFAVDRKFEFERDSKRYNDYPCCDISGSISVISWQVS